MEVSGSDSDDVEGESDQRQAFNELTLLSCGVRETCIVTYPCRSNLVPP